MLSWMSWWRGATPAADRGIDEPAPWAPAGLLLLQARLWEQAFAANRAWWELLISSMPSQPPAGRLVPPVDSDAAADAPEAPGTRAASAQAAAQTRMNR